MRSRPEVAECSGIQGRTKTGQYRNMETGLRLRKTEVESGNQTSEWNETETRGDGIR
jgi:hypothetical protein